MSESPPQPLSHGGYIRTLVWRVIKAMLLLPFPLLTILAASYKNVHDTWDAAWHVFKDERDSAGRELLQAQLGYTLEPSYIFGQGVSDLLQWHMQHWTLVAITLIICWFAATVCWCLRPSFRSALVFCGIAYIISLRGLMAFIFAL